ncbi:3-coathanger stack domain-containing protein [Lacihabitans lacunae]|uniref:3-coathanger stack domain-containing protein n=1 Tax=Lacihabitans lacunae TaxID=1028214 RepID=A0ABV7YY67_9BACT
MKKVILLFIINSLVYKLSAQSISSLNPIICGSNTYAVLTASSGTNYQWQFCATEYGTYTDISGATSSFHTTTTLGFYKVAVNGILSPAYKVANTPYATIKNANGNTNPIDAIGGNADLYIDFFGSPPFTANLGDYGNFSTVITSNTNQKIQTVTPESSRTFHLSGISHAGCQTSGYGNNNITVNVAPNPTLTIGSASTTACSGGFIQIPTTRTGNWGTSGFVSQRVSLYTSSGAYITNIGPYSDPTLNVQLPSNLTVGATYRLYVYSTIPYVVPSIHDFTISNTCPAPPSAIIDEQNSPCYLPTLKASPNGPSFTFQWKKDGVNIPLANGSQYYPEVSGNYSVQIQNTGLGYTSTSPSKSVVVYASEPTISSPNPILCGSNISATIISNYTGAGFTYTWHKNGVIIPEATSSSITVSDVGRYYVAIVNNTGCYLSTESIKVTYNGVGTLLNSNDTNESVFLSSPQTTENLKVNLTGTGPWEVGLSDGTTVRTYYSATSPLIIPVSPTSLTSYSIAYVSGSCGVNTLNNGNVIVGIAPAPNIIFPTPLNLNVCKGNIIEVPYSITGNIGNKLDFSILLGDPTGGESRGVYTYTNITAEPLQASGTIPIYIPNDISLGSYAILFTPFNPSLRLGNSIQGLWSSYAINVVNTGCPPISAPTISGRSSGCESINLIATPFEGFGGPGSNTYQWFKNGVALTGKTNTSLTAYESGNYTVQVINAATSYNQTSAAKSIRINRIIPAVTSSNPVICGSNTSATISTTYTGAGYTYQWYKDRSFSNGSVGQIPIFGASGSTYNATSSGFYSVKVFDGSCLQNSKFSLVDVNQNLVANTGFEVRNTATAKLTNNSNTNASETIAGGTSTTLKVNLTGGGPWSFELVGSDNSIRYFNNITTVSNDITVSPTVNTSYSLSNLTSSCGSGSVSGSVLIIVSPPPSFTIASAGVSSISGSKNGNGNNQIQSSTNICPGSSISVAYTISGNWTADREFTAELVNASTNASITGTLQKGFNTNPILFYVPLNVPAGTYKVKLTSTKPFIEGSVFSPNVIVSTTECVLPVATILSKTQCASSQLTASPSGNGYTYQWFKNSAPIIGAISESYFALSDGAYTVQINNAGTGLDVTSSAFNVAIEEISKNITLGTGSICNGNGSLIITSPNSTMSHQWYSSTDNVFFSPILGATNPTLTATIASYYQAIISNAGCEVKSNTVHTCKANINLASKTICAGSSIIVPFEYSGGQNHNLSLQLVNANTEAITVPNLATVITSNLNLYSQNLTIPSSVSPGTYKIKLIGPDNLSAISLGIITVSNQTVGTAPAVAASSLSVNSAQNVVLTAVGCVGDITWTSSDMQTSNLASFTSFVNKNTTYTAFCNEEASGCQSPSSSVTVLYDCLDEYEPNNTFGTSTAIGNNTFTSPVLCLNGFDNPDWFSLVFDGKTYFFKTALASNNTAAGNYKIKFSIAGNNLTVETLPEIVGQSLDTYLSAIDSDGSSILVVDDNSNANGFSKLSITLTGNPCSSALILTSINNPSDDISTGTLTKEANAITGMIAATNKLTGNAKVTYRAGKSIQLDPGFKADSGVVFKTEFGGCN